MQFLIYSPPLLFQICTTDLDVLQKVSIKYRDKESEGGRRERERDMVSNLAALYLLMHGMGLGLYA